MKKSVPCRPVRRFLLLAVAYAVAFAAGAYLMGRKAEPSVRPDPPALVTQLREVARLETLDVTLYKKVSFEPDPPAADSSWAALANWVKFSVSPPKGRAIVFAQAHLGLDVTKLDPSALRVEGDRVLLVLPPLQTRVELKPGDTEVIGSNLDSAQTAQLFDLAKTAFEREASADPVLREKAERSAERALRGLLLSVGFREVQFVTQLPPAPRAG
jgi:hypothetical protein